MSLYFLHRSRRPSDSPSNFAGLLEQVAAELWLSHNVAVIVQSVKLVDEAGVPYRDQPDSSNLAVDLSGLHTETSSRTAVGNPWASDFCYIRPCSNSGKRS